MSTQKKHAQEIEHDATFTHFRGDYRVNRYRYGDCIVEYVPRGRCSAAISPAVVQHGSSLAPARSSPSPVFLQLLSSSGWRNSQARGFFITYPSNGAFAQCTYIL